MIRTIHGLYDCFHRSLSNAGHQYKEEGEESKEEGTEAEKAS